METVHLSLKRMGCAACANRIEKALHEVPGIYECSVNFGMAQAKVEYNPKEANLETIQKAVSDAGYAAEVITDFNEGDREKKTA